MSDLAKQYDIPYIARVPIDPELADCCDNGEMESFEGGWVDGLADAIEKL